MSESQRARRLSAIEFMTIGDIARFIDVATQGTNPDMADPVVQKLLTIGCSPGDLTPQALRVAKRMIENGVVK